MKYIKKPIAIEAVQCFLPDKDGKSNMPDCVYEDKTSSTGYSIDTLEGKHEVTNGDYIITGIKGEKYPCKADIFEASYIPEDKIGELSDGYHTFDELYDHRITLFIALCTSLKRLKDDGVKLWKSYLHDDMTQMPGWFIAGITFWGGESITYHLPIDRWDELKVPDIAKAPKWDGHTAADVVERIKKYLY